MEVKGPLSSLTSHFPECVVASRCRDSKREVLQKPLRPTQDPPRIGNGPSREGANGSLGPPSSREGDCLPISRRGTAPESEPLAVRDGRVSPGFSFRGPPFSCLLSCLQVLSSSGSQRGFWALQLLHALRADIHEAIVHLWAQQIPALWGYCQAEGTRGSQPEWQQKLLQFLRRSLKTMEDDRWTKNLILALEDQMGSYADGSLEKSVLYQVLGLSLACCADRTYVLHWLERLIENANYLEAAEKEKVAEILSFAALDHLDLTLATLDDCRAGMDLKMGLSALLTHHKDYKTGRRGHLLKTLILAYSRVAIRAPKEFLLKSGEAEILKKVLDLYRMSFQVLGVKIESQARQDTHLKLLFCESVASICKAISEAQDGNFQLGCKKELLEALLAFLGTERLENLRSSLLPATISALVSLSHLKPRLPVEALREMLDGVIKSLFLLPPLERLKRIAYDEQDASNIELMYTRSVEAMGKLFEVLVTEEPTSERIDVMFQPIEPWFLECEGSRERALQASFQVLAPFQASFHLPPDVSQAWTRRRPQGLRAGLIQSSSPLWDDADELARFGDWPSKGWAFIWTKGSWDDLSGHVQTWAQLYKPHSSLKHCFYDEIIRRISFTRANLSQGSPSCSFQVPELLDTFCSHLPIITQGGMEEVLLEAVCIMARSHLDTVLGHLLRRSLPLDSETGKLWRSFDRDPSLAVRVLAKLTSCVNQPSILGSTTSSSIDESGDYAEEEPLKATCAIYEVLSGLPSEVDLQKVFPELLFTLLWQVSQTLGQKMPPCEGRRRLFLREQHLTPGNPCSLSVDTLKALVVKGTPIASQEEIKTADFWALLGDPRTHPEGLCQLTKCLLENGLLKDQVIQDVLPWMDASSEKLRLAGTALFTEVIQEPSFTRWAALRAFVPTLIRNVEDQNAGIRRMALRSLGRLLLVAPDQVKGLKKDLLILLFNHLRDSAVVDEALEALALVLPCLRMGKVAFLFRDLCWRASKYLSEEDDAIRAAAFHLFGALATRAKQGYKTFFANLVKENLALLLIYQGDPNPNISEACKMAFLQCLPFVTKRHLQQLHQTTESSNINALCQQLVQECPHLSMGLQRDLVPYFQSRQEELQRRAVEISGALLQSTPVTALDERTLQLLLTELAPLQGDASTTLQSAAEALEDHVHQKTAELQDDATRGSRTTQNSATWYRRLLGFGRH
uniref:Maestro heat-like repeat-containing protein family member 2B n=1 Tax=Pogona vitticeps TaxID=103695 RepID=A0ABM5EY76_9SAUR